MLIVTGANNVSIYAQCSKLNLKQAERFGYKTQLYDFGGLGRGIDFFKGLSTKPAEICYRKVDVIRHAVQNTNEELVVWMDADALLVKPIDEVDTKDYDVGVSVRAHKEQPYNTGVLFFYNNERTHRFLDLWLKQKPEYIGTSTYKYSDQAALNKMFQRYDSSKLGVNIKEFPTTVYNNYYPKELDKDKLADYVKVIHFKGDRVEDNVIVGQYREKFSALVERHLGLQIS